MGMTNQTQEVTMALTESEELVAALMRPAKEASWEAREVHKNGLTAIAEEEEYEQDLVIGAANVCKRVRHVNAEPDVTCNVTMNEDGNNSSKDTATKNEGNCNADDEENVFVDGTTASSSGGDDDGKGDYVYVGTEEEVGTYKTSNVATLPQSEHDIIQQQLDQGENALISQISLFFVGTWNWLHYFLVTIIFLNLVHFADRRSGDSVVGEERSVEVDGEETPKGNIDLENCAFGKGDLEIGGNDIVNIDTISSEKNISKSISGNKETMSPNTCSIQNQEVVDQAQEAMTMMEKGGEPTPQVEESVPVIENGKSEAIIEQPEITVVLAGEIVDECESDETGGDDMDTIRRDSVDSYTSSSDGNLGDTEEQSENKTSENKDDENADPAVAALTNQEVAQKIISQVESMFSDEHLAKDGFLLKHVRRRSDGFVSLKLVAGLRKVKQISREFPTVLTALRDSSKLEINTEGTKVRRVEPLSPFLKSVPIKSKDKEVGKTKDKDTGSSNEENQQPPAQIQNGATNNKCASKTGNKENDNGKRGQNRRNSQQNQNNGNNGSRRNSNVQNQNRKSSNASTTSSNGSRHNSFSKASVPTSGVHPADLLRNVYTMTPYSSSGEECQSPQSGRRRGGSLPITALQRNPNGAYLSPNSSPPNGALTFTIGPNGGARPKSNSYCEGVGPSTMSPWLQRRKASASSRLSQGELIIAGVIRQPRGPDGTKGFPNGYRAIILQERLQQKVSAVSA